MWASNARLSANANNATTVLGQWQTEIQYVIGLRAFAKVLLVLLYHALL
jgi:hypothetical protein